MIARNELTQFIKSKNISVIPHTSGFSKHFVCPEIEDF
jgi:hypothetical protein